MISLHEKIETTFIQALSQCVDISSGTDTATTACVEMAAIYTLVLYPKHAQFINDLAEFWGI